MSIQLIAPVFVAGTLQPTGTALTLSADQEAEYVNRGVAVYTGAGDPSDGGAQVVTAVTNPDSSVSFIVDGIEYAALPVDENNNVIANVNHRTGLLGNASSGLLSLGGGLGEIAVATDVDALVVYTGVVGQAEAYFRSPINNIALTKQAVTTSAVVSGAATSLNLGASVSDVKDRDGIIDLANDIIVVRRSTVVGITGVIQFGASASGSVRKIGIEADVTGSGLWLETGGNISVPVVANALIPFTLTTLAEPSDPAQPGRIRLRVTQDSGSNMDIVCKSYSVFVAGA